LGGVYGYSPANQPLSFEDWSAQQPVPEPVKKKKHHGGGLFGGGLLGSILAPDFTHGLADPISAVYTEAKATKANAAGGGPVNDLQTGYQQYLANFKAPAAQTQPDYSNFFASPDYQFRLRQGEQSVQNSAAAQGGLYSGNAGRALSDYGQGTAAGEFGNWFNRNAALAGIGQTATSQVGQGALTTGANIGNLLTNQGNARASGIIDQTNSMTNTINQLAQLWGSGAFGRKQSPVTTYQPTGIPAYQSPWSGVPS
jgi:hypothetical protein